MNVGTGKRSSSQISTSVEGVCLGLDSLDKGDLELMACDDAAVDNAYVAAKGGQTGQFVFNGPISGKKQCLDWDPVNRVLFTAANCNKKTVVFKFAQQKKSGDKFVALMDADEGDYLTVPWTLG
jgi:hypothetical protein